MWVIAKFLCLFASYIAGIVGGVFLHELGHSLAALLATRQRIALEVGTAGRRYSFVLGRLEIVVFSRGIKYGLTRYDRLGESRWSQTLVALGGPLASLAAVVGFAWLTTGEPVGSWSWITFFGMCVANFRILLTSLWPIEFRPHGPDGEVWLSDSLDLWRMWRSERL